MPTSDVVEGFAELFEGRKDAYGADSGGCVRVCHEREWQPYLWEKHLTGEQPIGVYPISDSVHGHRHDLVKWGCVDFDRKSEGHKSFDYETEEECHTAAVNLQKVLAALHVTAWIERTRSCGRHVWIFSSNWVPASTMRRSLLISCGVAGVSQREVNPKSETLTEGQLGNYVRLPYPGGLLVTNKYAKTQVMMKVGYMANLSLQELVRAALAARTAPAVLEGIAAKWKPLPEGRVTINFPLRYEGDPLQLVSRLTATGRSVFTNGPNDGDRSRGMVYLAKQAKLSSLEPSEAAILLASAHWNKYRGRADEVKQIEDIVSRAWA